MNLNNKIEWLQGGATWNPVTGCLHGCKFCYAERIARRFGIGSQERFDDRKTSLFVLDEPYKTMSDFGTKRGEKHYINPYPYLFMPTFHRYRLDEPQKIKKPQNIFVCSMADLFGDWIPDEWIQRVFDACKAAPQHRYLFLTKNPMRYASLKLPLDKNMMFGATITNKESKTPFYSQGAIFQSQRFISIEPLLDDIADQYKLPINNCAWVIIGAETGNRKDKVIPKKEWVQNIVDKCREQKIPVFMKDSLKDVYGGLIREYPW